MLTAKNHIDIDQSIEKVWDLLTSPAKQYWIDDEGSWIISDWRVGSPVRWIQKSGDDYWRGEVTEVEPKSTLAFYMHDAYEEDNSEPDFGEDLFDEGWKFILENADGKTRLTLEIEGDEGHDTDDAHDHEEAIKTSDHMTSVGIPKKLEKIKQLVST